MPSVAQNVCIVIFLISVVADVRTKIPDIIKSTTANIKIKSYDKICFFNVLHPLYHKLLKKSNLIICVFVKK